MKTENRAELGFTRAVHLSKGLGDRDRGEVRQPKGRASKLTEREAALLHFLASRAGQPVSRDDILCHVWRLDPRRTLTRTVDMHVAKLRHKLQDDPAKPKFLFTVHGKGYMLASSEKAGP